MPLLVSESMPVSVSASVYVGCSDSASVSASDSQCQCQCQTVSVSSQCQCKCPSEPASVPAVVPVSVSVSARVSVCASQCQCQPVSVSVSAWQCYCHCWCEQLGVLVNTTAMDFLCWCCMSPAWDNRDDSTTLTRKLTAVGDGACGKTSLLVRISRDTFVADGYRPTDFDTDVIDVFSGDKKVEMVLQDSAGQETYDRLRHVVYVEVDVILLCFSLDDPDSLVNVENSWIQEVRYYCPNVPVILVGNKKDLRDVSQGSGVATGQRFVTCKEGKDAAKRIKAKDYVECSAKDGSNCKKLLGTAVRLATSHKPYNSQSAR